ncbi:hypothetical protein [Pseudodesulfovibrio sp. S3]|uniref:hypothetical protein n=2 Tax=unclassified Pseudodesulfovibrio TaxID=2661612 RepID=UPI0010062244|nr:hypothetical protein [Pseudodesulfovibrio sp. S3]MCJ2163458.1 hypothetical protein [Pseudodesulfovibrio sp. S3-i]RWU06694.1 hypothetical protein DWB63_02720 [Pseudodesulfovibrio sp. S3]
MNIIVADISRQFPQTFFAQQAKRGFYKCNAWDKLIKRIKALSRSANWGEQSDYINDLYSVLLYIRPNDTKEFALKKKKDKSLGYFTICPHCWRFVFKRYNKIRKDPFCCFHTPGEAEYQRAHRALQRMATESPGLTRLLELRSHFLAQTSDVIRPRSVNYLTLKIKKIFDPDAYTPASYDLQRIWPYLPRTERLISKEGGDVTDIHSVVSILDPVDRIDPLDMWDENDTEGAEFVRGKRLILHEIIGLDASIFKFNLCLAEAWLALLEEHRSKGRMHISIS